MCTHEVEATCQKEQHWESINHIKEIIDRSELLVLLKETSN